MRTGSFEWASLSDVGRVRSTNEDSCGEILREDGCRVLIVADGMGGHRGGATASQTAVEILQDHFAASDETDLGKALLAATEAANTRVYSLAQEDPTLEGMGTTVVALALDSVGRGAIAHVGDSRAYRLRNHQLEALTHDHSVVGEMLRQGLLTEEEATTHPRRHEILRSVGVLPVVSIDVQPITLQDGDRILLCSDGLSGLVGQTELESMISQGTPEESVRSMIQLANERGGLDNITAQILAFSRPDSSAAQKQRDESLTNDLAKEKPDPKKQEHPLQHEPGEHSAPPDQARGPRSAFFPLFLVGLIAYSCWSCWHSSGIGS